MTRNVLSLIIGALLVVSVVLGYFLYQERQKKETFQLSVGGHGIALEKK